mmetsp:Transcript_11831/g.21626  ORF Transcript_11831/g.21626 Transcript_11831/m.21626 type:complete len:108 (+) Transcript_11831:2828-3151(+)
MSPLLELCFGGVNILDEVLWALAQKPRERRLDKDGSEVGTVGIATEHCPSGARPVRTEGCIALVAPLRHAASPAGAFRQESAPDHVPHLQVLHPDSVGTGSVLGPPQ